MATSAKVRSGLADRLRSVPADQKADARLDEKLW